MTSCFWSPATGSPIASIALACTRGIGGFNSALKKQFNNYMCIFSACTHTAWLVHMYM